jgi:hypothetical protein
MLPRLPFEAIEERWIEITDENLSHGTTSKMTCYQNESTEAPLSLLLPLQRGHQAPPSSVVEEVGAA